MKSFSVWLAATEDRLSSLPDLLFVTSQAMLGTTRESSSNTERSKSYQWVAVHTVGVCTTAYT